jgi:hypothetical protein
MTFDPDNPNHDPDLAEYDEAFDDAPMPGGGFRTVPNGTYQAVVERALVDHPEWSDYPRLSLTCNIINGDYSGCKLFPNQSFNPDYIHFLKGTLVKMGFDPPPRPSEIRGCLASMYGRVLEIYVAEKKPDQKYANVYVNSFVRMMDEPTGHNGSDIPF